MLNNYRDSKEDKNWSSVIIRIIGGLFCGGLFALGAYWITELKDAWLFIVPGALLGGVIGLCWQTFASLWMRLRSEDWQVTDIEIVTLGQKWKLANSGSQRRVAWSLFVEMATRIATQPMEDMDGDDGVALNSLYDLFQSTRKSITGMEPTHVLPYRRKSLDTVESYALAMLNQDLRPFLSKWHPVWDAWRKANPNASSSSWEHHAAFRADLKILQSTIRERAEGLGKIAGVSEISRFMNESQVIRATKRIDLP